MKLVNAEHGDHDTHQLHIGLLAQAVCGVVLNPGARDAILVGDDSMNSVHGAGGQVGGVGVPLCTAVGREGRLALGAEQAGTSMSTFIGDGHPLMPGPPSPWRRQRAPKLAVGRWDVLADR